MTNDVIECKATVDEQEYTLTVKFAKVIDENDPNQYTFFSIFFKNMMKMMDFEQIGRNCFNPKQAKQVQTLEVWPGFYSAMQNVESGLLMQIDLTSKVCRKDKVLNHMNQMLDKGKS